MAPPVECTSSRRVRLPGWSRISWRASPGKGQSGPSSVTKEVSLSASQRRRYTDPWMACPPRVRGSRYSRPAKAKRPFPNPAGIWGHRVAAPVDRPGPGRHQQLPAAHCERRQPAPGVEVDLDACPLDCLGDHGALPGGSPQSASWMLRIDQTRVRMLGGCLSTVTTAAATSSARSIRRGRACPACARRPWRTRWRRRPGRLSTPGCSSPEAPRSRPPASPTWANLVAA